MEQSQQFGVQCSQVLTNGKKICVLLDAPAEAFDGEPAGFSSYKEILKFEYDGNTWQYPGTGTLIVSLDGDELELDFTTYGDVEGHYSGTAVVVK